MQAPSGDALVCGICNYWGSDIKVKSCGCHIHTRCVPLSMIVDSSSASVDHVSSCPCCKAPSSGLYLFPLSFADLEESVRLRKIEALKKNSNRARDDDDLEIEAQYLVFSQGRNTLSSTLSDTDNARTGRWTDKEVAFVDHLLQSFDNGLLPLSHGVKLSSFLGDILLCRASRLTKKMKNAKLSTRSFDFNSSQSPERIVSKEDCQLLSALQDQFIGSMNTKVSQLELKFNLVKQWRTYFSNLCVQIGYQALDAGDWIASLEEMERKASQAEDKMRVVRRKRMGLKMKSSVQPPLKMIRSDPSLHHGSHHPRMDHVASSPSLVVSSELTGRRTRSLSYDLDNAFMSLYDSNPVASSIQNPFVEKEKAAPSVGNDFRLPSSASKEPFMDAISRYMETSCLPYQHADVWVPSFTSGSDEQVQLLHAGHATRRDQGGNCLSSFQNFGEFSKSFVFHPNHGLPGKVYASGKPQWEFQLYDPTVFPRYQGAQAYGLRTATAIPIATPGVGRMVVVFYSSTKVLEDSALVNRCTTELTSYLPAPKWKLVIEMGEKPENLLSKTSPECKPEETVESQFASIEDAAQDRYNDDEDDVAHKIVTLMGNEMLPAASSTAGESTSSSQDLVPHFMAIRLLLLRPASNCSSEENDLIDILKESYKSYSNDSKKSGPELARLLAREYICLKASSPTMKAAAPAPGFPPKQTSSTNLPSQIYTSQQFVDHVSLPPLMTSKGMTAPPLRLPTVFSHSNSDEDLSSMRRTVSCSTVATVSKMLESRPCYEQPPSF